MYDYNLSRKVILITGAASGIGRECAIACASRGAALILIDQNKHELEYTMELTGIENCHLIVLDLLKYTEIEPAIKEKTEKTGKIHGFIHSAGIGLTKPLKLISTSDYEKIFAVNAISAFELIRILSKKIFCPEQGASYILISSVMGKLGDIGNIAYCASKGALIPASKAMALELASKKIRVNCILPGVIMTEMAKKLFETISEDAKNELLAKHPLGFGHPCDVANSCVYLLSDASRWVTGSEFIVDGGYSAH